MGDSAAVDVRGAQGFNALVVWKRYASKIWPVTVTARNFSYGETFLVAIFIVFSWNQMEINSCFTTLLVSSRSLYFVTFPEDWP